MERLALLTNQKISNFNKEKKMKEIKLNKTQKGNDLIVEVELPRRQFIKDPVVEFSNSDLLAYLKQEGIVLQDYDMSDRTHEYLTSHSNKSQEPILSGKWVFTKKQKEKVNKRTAKTYNKRAKENPTGD